MESGLVWGRLVHIFLYFTILSLFIGKLRFFCDFLKCKSGVKQIIHNAPDAQLLYPLDLVVMTLVITITTHNAKSDLTVRAVIRNAKSVFHKVMYMYVETSFNLERESEQRQDKTVLCYGVLLFFWVNFALKQIEIAKNRLCLTHSGH